MQNQATSQVSLTQFTAVAGKIGLLSFGGPAAQIALMQDEVVDKRGWVSQQDFLRALSFCMLLPGPEAMQLATYLGWRLHGLRGGFIGGTLFILPGACVIFAWLGLTSTLDIRAGARPHSPASKPVSSSSCYKPCAKFAPGL